MLIIGHRGARGLASENTLASIQAALTEGVDMIEFDVRNTGDGIPVLHHDSAVTLDGKTFTISKTDYQALLYAKPDLATLSDALGTIGSQASVCIEIKQRVRTEPIADVIRNYISSGGSPEMIYIGSKDQKVLRAVHDELPDLTKIVIEPWSSIRAVFRARQVGTRLLSMNQLFLWRGFIRSMSQRHWQLLAYTVNNPNRAEKWQRAGLYGIVTDFPDRYSSKK